MLQPTGFLGGLNSFTGMYTCMDRSSYLIYVVVYKAVLVMVLRIYTGQKKTNSCYLSRLYHRRETVLATHLLGAFDFLFTVLNRLFGTRQLTFEVVQRSHGLDGQTVAEDRKVKKLESW